MPARVLDAFDQTGRPRPPIDINPELLLALGPPPLLPTEDPQWKGKRIPYSVMQAFYTAKKNYQDLSKKFIGFMDGMSEDPLVAAREIKILAALESEEVLAVFQEYSMGEPLAFEMDWPGRLRHRVSFPGNSPRPFWTCSAFTAAIYPLRAVSAWQVQAIRQYGIHIPKLAPSLRFLGFIIKENEENLVAE